MLLDPLTGKSTVLGSLNTTSLGRDLRAQDQACLAVSPTGGTVAVQASYNIASGLLDRGLFIFRLSGTTATLVSETKAFDDTSFPHYGLFEWA
jgi:hypothetical protein